MVKTHHASVFYTHLFFDVISTKKFNEIIEI